jgi:N-acyl-L-homoserine lactone synthetase
MGIVLGFEFNGELIGTIRIVPMGYGLTLTEELLPRLGADAPALGEGDWEVGRLVVAPDYRSDIETLRACMHRSLVYGCRQARVTRLYATCTHVLSRLYRRFGFTAYARDVPLRDTGKSYTMISGPAAVVSGFLAGESAAAAH